MTYRRKLIEVGLPLDAINKESAREKSIRHGHPSTLHLWWARRPLAACRAVIFSSLVDDPEEPGVPKALLDAIDALPYEGDAEEAGGSARRAKLYGLIEQLVLWENTTNEAVLEDARGLIRASTGGNPPPLLDPFCGGGSIPLEGQRLGLEVYASDLNPVAVLITKALVEIPPKFAGRPPVNPDDRDGGTGGGADWRGAAGLAADVRWYGQWMRDEAEKRIGHLYPKGPSGETVIAWLWARTVTCPNPACGAEMPLVRSFWLSKKKGRPAWVEPIVDRAAKTVRFEVRTEGEAPAEGTVGRGAVTCLTCSGVSKLPHVRAEAQAGRMHTVPLAIVLEGERRRLYLSPILEHEQIARRAQPAWKPEELVTTPSHDVDRLPMYGMPTWGDAFTSRQLVALTTFSDLVGEARALVREHAAEAGLPDDGLGIANGGAGADAYADAVATFLGLCSSKAAAFHNVMARWRPGEGKSAPAFGRQAIPMVWDFAEVNPFAGAGGDFAGVVTGAEKTLGVTPATSAAVARQLDAASAVDGAFESGVFTDPPYYDNVGYADLSDFFYVWLRRSLGRTYPDLFATLLTPKTQELVAGSHRFGGDRKAAERHFESGLGSAFALMRERAAPDVPMTLFYAFKQAESRKGSNGETAAVSTGWETMLSGLIAQGFRVTGTWPMRTENPTRQVAMGTNTLASSVVLVCRPRAEDAPLATRRDFVQALRDELPGHLRVLMGGRVGAVDFAQAAIGPGMAVFSRYGKVLEAGGGEMSVRTALELINEAIEAYLTEQEGGLDRDSQFCVRWLEQYGFGDGPFGDADNLARAKNVGVEALARDGVLVSRGGDVRLQPLTYYREGVAGYDPAADTRPTTWEACHYLVAALDAGGEQEAGRLARRLGGLAEQARELAYRLYAICDRKKWAEEALGYNGLVASWTDIRRVAAEQAEDTQARLV